MPDVLPEDFERALSLTASRRGAFGAVTEYYNEIGSTNDRAARLAETGASEGTTVIALAQSAGRGRLGRTWFSPPGAGLYVSVLVRDPRVIRFLTLAGGIAVADGIRSATGLEVQIKWPNDIVAGAGLGKRRKLAGVLAEATSGADVQHVVLGFGINIRPAAYPAEIADRATSLEAEVGRPVEAGVLLSECLAHLAEHTRALSAGESRRLLDRWSALAPSAQGSAVEWDTDTGPRRGRTAGIDRDGALLVRTGDTTERILSGTVRWL